MRGVRLQSQAEPDDPRCDALWQRAAGLGVPISPFPPPPTLPPMKAARQDCAGGRVVCMNTAMQKRPTLLLIPLPARVLLQATVGHSHRVSMPRKAERGAVG